MMTAVDVRKVVSATESGASAWATVGVRLPVWAADRNRPEPARVAEPGTINLVASVPDRLSDAALVNAIATMTEAKVQALHDHKIAGTGTASDALCLLCPVDGAEEPFGGPRSLWGGRLAQATYDAVVSGLVRQRDSGSA
jgi:adenosylcobinamide hydrolase